MVYEVTRHLSPFTDEEEMYRASVRAFLDHELDPHADKFVGDLDYDRQFWRKAGQAGLLGAIIPEEYGGPGASDICGVILSHELGRSVGGATVGSSISGDIATHLLMKGGSDQQKRRWAPGILAGEIIQAMPLTEAGAGSDATAIKTSAIKRNGVYVLNGSKTYISTGNKAHLLYVVAKTDPTKRGSGMSMFLVEAETPGVSRRRMSTMGYPAYDLAEIFFDDVEVPPESLMLGEGRALEIVMQAFAYDRMDIAARSLGEAELAFDLALEFVKERKAFGQPVLEFQNTQFVLADMKTEIEVGRSFLHDGIRKLRSKNFNLSDGAMLKLWLPEMSHRVVDRALQMFGGSGFMDQSPISKLYRANRLNRLYGGTSELQKVAIAKTFR